jgi:hypothetical protein
MGTAGVSVARTTKRETAMDKEMRVAFVVALVLALGLWRLLSS